MAPIRTAIIGLSSQTGDISASPGDGWAASAHLPYLIKSPHYQIVALCNSSEKSAKAAVERHKLPASTKTYGSPEALAKDSDVDLVVCNVRVDRHYEVMMPILKAGKDAFVEWPLGSNLQQAEEMLATAKQSGSNTIVGLQARNSPVTQKIKKLIEKKAIGDLLSTEMQVYAGYLGSDTEPPGIDYLSKKEVGGNVFTIYFAHMADPLFYALGKPKEVSGLLATRWKKVKLPKPDGTFDKMIDRETPDQIMMQGTLQGTNAPYTVYLRGGKGFKDSPLITWRIFGTKGEIRIASGAPIGLGVGKENIELYDHEKDAVEVVQFSYLEPLKDLPPMAKNIGGLYELFASGEGLESGLVTFEEAVGMHKILAAIEKSNAEKKVIKIAS